jgi:hypothetical protein
MILGGKIRAENVSIFPSHLDCSEKLTELGRIRGFDFRLAIEGSLTDIRSINLVWFQRFVFGSIRTFEPGSKRFNIGCVKCVEIARLSHQFVGMTLVCKIRAENESIFPLHLDSSQKHIELG